MQGWSQTMPRSAKGLTAAFVDKATTPGRYADGGGLYLKVRSKTAKFWESHFTLRGKRRSMGGGPATGPNAIGLAQARVWNRQGQAVAREGRDPIAERKAAKAKEDADEAKAKAKAITFAQVTDMYDVAHQAAWGPKHRTQWRSSLRDYVLSGGGDLPVGDFDTGVVMTILEPLWRTKTETASRVRGRIEAILDYAKARDWREGENPARWRGHLDHLLPKRSKAQRPTHYEALPWREVGAFMQQLRRANSIPARCLEFLILTACRSGEARGARWDEFDLAHGVWTVPAGRMKSGREHRTPLSEPALAVLHEMARFGSHPADLVFPGARAGRPLGDMTLTKAARDAGAHGASVHGFRSTSRDWCAEATNYPRELAEAALAHTLHDKVEAAYQRGDLLERRRRLMSEWATFCGEPMTAGGVVALHAAR
jgi:integrase